MPTRTTSAQPQTADKVSNYLVNTEKDLFIFMSPLKPSPSGLFPKILNEEALITKWEQCTLLAV